MADALIHAARQAQRIDTRPVIKVTCYRCHGFKVIDRYVGDQYHPRPCGACDQNGMIEVYAPLPSPPADTWKTRALIAVDRETT